VIVDSGDHASILDGCLLSRAKLRPFRHNRLDKLEKMLTRAVQEPGGVLVVVDGVFSMEGDLAPLREICALCRGYGARLMVDEAHGVGVLGRRGAGCAELLGVEQEVDLRMGTFSKSLASCGGFIAGPSEVIEYLRISSRPFLFTASGVPAALGAALAALRVLRSAEGKELFERVLQNAWQLRDGLHELGFAVVDPQALTGADRGVADPAAGGTAAGPPDGRTDADAVVTDAPAPFAESPGVRVDHRGAAAIVTPIIPVLVGDDWKAGELWRSLYDAGVFVNTAVHPAVPPGGALLRTSVMATHDESTLRQALEIFAQVKRRFEAEHGPLPAPEPA
jgi:8-amino-7-oxononanoate synthase